MELCAYDSSMEAGWDALCAASASGTFLHSRRFLAYHGARFQDRSVCLHDKGALAAVLPAALAPDDAGLVVSHPGSTFGGWVHAGRLHGARMLEALELLKGHYAALGHRRLLYKAVPGIYHRRPAQDDLYALFRLGARRVRCDLSSCIDLAERPAPDKQRRWELRQGAGRFAVVEDAAQLEPYWTLLESTLAGRHGARPVHSLDEIRGLMARFPDELRLVCAVDGGAPVAGSLLFCGPRVWHAQYMASSLAAREAFGLDAVMERCIAMAAEAGARFFDFGISNEDGGRILNDGLHRYKAKFGAGGAVHEFYELELA